MHITRKVQKILNQYQGDNPGSLTNIAKILMHGKLAGSGKMIILPVDQGFEHGPARSFAQNPKAYDPAYHYQLAIDAGLNAFAAPLGMLEAGARTFAGAIPTILKLNSSNSWAATKDQAITAQINDALRLGCAAVGFTIYPGADNCFNMIEEIQSLANEAKSVGLAVVIWSYPRGSKLTQKGETAIDVTAYAAHMAALLGAHIIKIKPPTNHIEQPEAQKIYQQQNIKIDKLSDRVAHIMQSAFDSKRLVVFSGGSAKSDDELLTEIQGLADGGASGSIIGRNSFQKPKADALKLLSQVIEIYRKS